jgi:multidrug efflux pump
VLARFFIDRPIFAWVLSLVIILIGAVAALMLPIDLYPNITPPTVQVTCNYPGASATVVADTVAAPLEQQVNGVEDMLYMSSQSANDGTYTLTVTFAIGTDVNMAQVLVQNRVALAMPQLPSQVQLEGVSVLKTSPNILFGINLISPDHRYNALFLSNFATIQIVNELARIDGVGQIKVIGVGNYSMRIWLDPYKLASRSLTAVDVVTAIQNQNIQVAAGEVGQEPVPPGQAFQLPMNALGQLTTERQFGDIILKAGAPNAQTNPASPVVRVRDVAKVEMGAQTYTQSCRLDGEPSAIVAVFQLPGSNALDVADRVKGRLEELKSRFPPGLEYRIVYDTTPFIRQSIDDVFDTLVEAVFLVALVVLFFLQDWKAMILPMIDVPVSLVGTFAVLAVLGFTLNNLTLFGLVLAIGIVVDDAIVVLENIERLIATGLDARTATIKAMDELTGPIIAITLVLSSVFIPSIFIPSLTGQFYRQFAVTIATAVIISAVNALTLTPSRAVSIFRTEEIDEHGVPKKEALPWWIFAVVGGVLTVWFANRWPGGIAGLPTPSGQATSTAAAWALRVAWFIPGALIGGVIGWFIIRPVNAVLGAIFRAFNRFFERVTQLYGWVIGRMLRVTAIVGVVYCGLLFATAWGVAFAPKGFIPTQDQGYLLVSVQLPDSQSLQRTEVVMQKLNEIAHQIPGVAHTVAISGTSFLLSTNGSNLGSMFVVLKDYSERTTPDTYDAAIAQKIEHRCAQEVEGATVGVFRAPPIRGLGNAGGFQLQAEQHGTFNLVQLQHDTDRLVARLSKDPHFAGVFTVFRAAVPSLYVDIDRTEVQALQIPLQDVFTTLNVFMGGLYVNQFNEFGFTWQVQVEAAPEFRTSASLLKQFEVRTSQGDMVPLGSIAHVKDATTPLIVMRYNMYASAAINGTPAPDVSTGTMIDEVTRIAKEMDIPFEWTQMTFLEVQAGNIAYLIFALGTLLVYFVLSAKYESWRLPLAVILVVPLCMLAAVTGMTIARLPIDIFVQIGLLVLVGLASKNAILIVEFARDQRLAGKELHESALTASKTRFRPIIMTSFAFIFGVLPLVLATGAGAEMRQSLGTAVFSGMIGVTLFGIFLTPVFFFGLMWFDRHSQRPAQTPPDETGSPASPVRDDGDGHVRAASAQAHPLPPT